MNNKPNVLLISVDHWPGDLLGCEGRTDIMTPTLDYLAHQGLRFSNFYSTCPVCIPARRSMMTGMTPRSHGDRVYADRLPMPDATTLAQAFKDAGYQSYAVGKLHVYPQRDRIGFDDVCLMEEARYEFGVVDDYQIWLGENGYLGQEYAHGIGNNTYLTRPWHLDERAHPTSWVAQQMAKQIKRKDPTRPAFYFCSFPFPHPPLVPLRDYWDMYEGRELSPLAQQDWLDDCYISKALQEQARPYTDSDIARARRAFHAQCTHIDQAIRLLIGTLRECQMLDNTLIAFTSDHGDMLFNHGMVGKRCFYEPSARVPFILSGKPALKYAGHVDSRLADMTDLMPTLLGLCGIDIPTTVDGKDLLAQHGPVREHIYGEVGTGPKASRMIRWQDYKLIYYPCGNVKQLFDLKADPSESHNVSDDPKLESVRRHMEAMLAGELYGEDLSWLAEGQLAGFPEPAYREAPDFGLNNQRGYHWPPPPAL